MRVCEICSKGSMIGKSGAHQYGGGWAMRATKKRRVWMVNLHAVKVTYQGVRRTMRLCTKCLRRVKALSPARHPELGSGSKESIKKETISTPKVKKQAPIVAASQ